MRDTGSDDLEPLIRTATQRAVLLRSTQLTLHEKLFAIAVREVIAIRRMQSAPDELAFQIARRSPLEQELSKAKVDRAERDRARAESSSDCGC